MWIAKHQKLALRKNKNIQLYILTTIQQQQHKKKKEKKEKGIKN